VAFEVTEAGNDLGLLAQAAGAAKDALGVDTIEVAADRGYYKGEDIQVCEQAGITAYVARPQRGSVVRDDLFHKEEFAYDAETDTYRCPNQQRLQRMYWAKQRVWSGGSMPTALRAGPALFGLIARTPPFARPPAGSTKRCWIEWKLGWLPGPRSSTGIARSSSTRLAASSNGIPLRNIEIALKSERELVLA